MKIFLKEKTKKASTRLSPTLFERGKAMGTPLSGMAERVPSLEMLCLETFVGLGGNDAMTVPVGLCNRDSPYTVGEPACAALSTSGWAFKTIQLGAQGAQLVR
jgi:hypothetical protein